ncbi:MAG: hydrogenase maturation protease [Coriobacteriales bacterium]|jgi:hydrogenase maturation protease|nr:hydrogenase maturation protease [Coriobacteriales bacterium]
MNPTAKCAGIAQRILVLCVGNILMLDDGLGPRLAQELRRNYEFDANTCVLDRATMGMALLSDLKAFDVVLLVDAVDNTGLEPGTVVSFSPAEVAPYAAFHGAHDTRFADVLAAAQLLGYPIDGHCLGVQIANGHPEQCAIGLTPAVEAALPALQQAVLSFLIARGAVVARRGD